MYTNYCNPNQLLNRDQKYCRLLGYYIDAGKNWNVNKWLEQKMERDKTVLVEPYWNVNYVFVMMMFQSTSSY